MNSSSRHGSEAAKHLLKQYREKSAYRYTALRLIIREPFIMNCFSLFGLALDVGGAILLIHGEFRQLASIFVYKKTGEQSDNYKKRLNTLRWWQRWPIEISSLFGSMQHMGSDPPEHTFPVKVWGLVLLILGFLLQALGVLFPSV